MDKDFITSQDTMMAAIVKFFYFLALPGFVVLFFLAQNSGYLPSVSLDNKALIEKILTEQAIGRSFERATRDMYEKQAKITAIQTHIMRVNCMNDADTEEKRNRCMSSPLTP